MQIVLCCNHIGFMNPFRNRDSWILIYFTTWIARTRANGLTYGKNTREFLGSYSGGQAISTTLTKFKAIYTPVDLYRAGELAYKFFYLSHLGTVLLTGWVLALSRQSNWDVSNRQRRIHQRAQSIEHQPWHNRDQRWYAYGLSTWGKKVANKNINWELEPSHWCHSNLPINALNFPIVHRARMNGGRHFRLMRK